jgi:hypothetical protein
MLKFKLPISRFTISALPLSKMSLPMASFYPAKAKIRGGFDNDRDKQENLRTIARLPKTTIRLLWILSWLAP